MNNSCDLSMINGNSIDIEPKGCDSEIKADIVVSEFNSTRLWGQIVNCYGESVSNALLKLVKVVTDCNGRCTYQGIAHSVSDCDGFYQFDLCVDEKDAKYKILVNKSATGMERIIEPSGGNCRACTENSYSPCGEYKYRVTPPDRFNCGNEVPTSCNCCCEEPKPQPQPCYNYCTDKNSSYVGGNMYVPSKVRF